MCSRKGVCLCLCVHVCVLCLEGTGLGVEIPEVPPGSTEPAPPELPGLRFRGACVGRRVRACLVRALCALWVSSSSRQVLRT